MVVGDIERELSLVGAVLDLDLVVPQLFLAHLPSRDSAERLVVLRVLEVHNTFRHFVCQLVEEGVPIEHVVRQVRSEVVDEPHTFFSFEHDLVRDDSVVFVFMGRNFELGESLCELALLRVLDPLVAFLIGKQTSLGVNEESGDFAPTILIGVSQTVLVDGAVHLHESVDHAPEVPTPQQGLR